ncbi:PREDICTED: uncharacterized protein LOC106126195 [Papilio xuthus]|uniref:Uncharacterized protein LOC106126195 n=1 Tax=Papilio xuthus TaxID=66420 RepID=A0AAJ6ZTW1_PAPXU|nr:PREDICTED: uncharacterized protein LOC106126195 [Papilio xuthus]
MNHQLEFYNESKQFPVYSLFPNPLTSKIDGCIENQLINLPRKLIQNGSSQPLSKLAPIGTGRPSSKNNGSSQMNPNVNPVKTFGTSIQTKISQKCLTSIHAASGQRNSTFYPTQWLRQYRTIAHQQFYTMTPGEAEPKQQNQNVGSTIWTVQQFDNKYKNMWSPLPVDRLPIGSHGHSQLFMKNLEHCNLKEKAIQGFNKDINQNLIIPQPFPGVNDMMAIPKPVISGFPRQTIGGWQDQAIQGLVRQNCDGQQDGATKKSGDNDYNGKKQMVSAKQLILKTEEPEVSAGNKNTPNHKTRPYVIYNSKYVHRRTKNKS